VSGTAGRHVGTALRRKEDARFLTGRGTYLDDVAIPGTLAVSIVRSPWAHAVIGAIDTTEALRSPGVAAAFTGADLAPLARPLSMDRIPFLKQSPWHALAGDRARFAGEPVAVVVAADPYRAEDAAELITVEYDPLPVAVDLEAAIGPDSPRLYEEWGDNAMLYLPHERGDLAGAFASADTIVEARFDIQRYTGVPLETRGCIASYEDGKLTLWSSTQWPFMVRMVLAESLGIPENRLRVIAPDVGGGFGNKQHVFREELLVCLLAMQLGRPVKWVEDRTESLIGGVHSRDQIHWVNVAAAADGRILGMRDRILANIGSGSLFFPGFAPAVVSAAFVPGPYDLPAFAFELTCVVTNKAPAGAYRGFGMPEAAFAMERSIDLVARRLGLDPADVRMRNLVRPQQMPYRSATGSLLDSGDYPATLQLALDTFDFPAFRKEQQQARGDGRHIGAAVVAFAEGSGPNMFTNSGRGGAYERAMIRMEPDASVTVFTGIVSQGQGHETTFAQVAADQLGVSPEDIRVVAGDTEGSVFGMGTWGGRGSTVGAGAVIVTAQKLREKILTIAASILEASPDDVDLGDGRAFIRGTPDQGVPLLEVATVAYHQTFRLPSGQEPGLEVSGVFDPPNVDPFPDQEGLLNACVTYSNAAHAAAVEVDLGLGTVKILRYVVAEDCGVMINPLVVEGQIRGGLAQGIGGALYEELVYDDAGQLRSASLMDYLMPTAAEMPRVEIVHGQSPAVYVPGGFKGMGEGGTIGPPSVLAAAVEDALSPFDVMVTQTPISPSYVLELLSTAGADGGGEDPTQSGRGS
jgi:aerobic carbon-monoxide dehydrogenase large subunit